MYPHAPAPGNLSCGIVVQLYQAVLPQRGCLDVNCVDAVFVLYHSARINRAQVGFNRLHIVTVSTTRETPKSGSPLIRGAARSGQGHSVPR